MSTTSIESIKRRCETLDRLISSCGKFLENMPEGHLRIKKLNGNCYYYLIISAKGNKKITYIGNKPDAQICKLAQKTYTQKLLHSARSELEILKPVIINAPKSYFEDVYYALPDERKQLIRPYILSDEDFAQKWQKQNFTPKIFKEGAPVYMTMRGERVRSKSEQIIADRLFVNGIPYKYECPIEIDGLVLHPDFTILRMSDRKEIYLEHCGKMDDPAYAQDAISRFNRYALSGIVPGDRLFTLYETNRNPLDTRILDKMIEQNFR